MKCAILALLVIVAVATAAPQGDKCSPWLSYCQLNEHCCRHLMCQPYLAKCIPKNGLIVPGQDKRPIGPGPYPPNVPRDEIPN